YAEDRLRECRDRLPMCTEDEQKKARRQNIWDKNPGFEEFDIAAVAEAEKVVNIIWNVGSATF
ncbi:MAG: hypothetical protein JRE24_01755, partial [Deltaproteobacteria bacterium]|nr:hypothetical protein [Deltaproteobacteria bacterium]